MGPKETLIHLYKVMCCRSLFWFIISRASYLSKRVVFLLGMSDPLVQSYALPGGVEPKIRTLLAIPGKLLSDTVRKLL